uniref:PLAT domain-containing protein n=1 Tax=Anas platyrhynchos TaxID=8839 RepID=A0A8B9R5E8_ANAPL
SPVNPARYHSARGDRPVRRGQQKWPRRVSDRGTGAGLSPSWYLQHVIVRDLQSSKSYFFLVNDWLSVESEENDGMVEKEVYAASECSLRSFSRIFIAELQRGFFEKHIWLSMWDRPPRSRFTRVQRATCCSLLIFLFLCANAVWYGMVGNPFPTWCLLTVDTVAVGLVSSVVVYPLYLVILFLFRMARGKVIKKSKKEKSKKEKSSCWLPKWVCSSGFLIWGSVLPLVVHHFFRGLSPCCPSALPCLMATAWDDAGLCPPVEWGAAPGFI